MKLTLGPVLFNWPTPVWADFYARIADEAPVDRVVIGEVVCSKRSPFRTQAVADAVEKLQRGGKEVVIAALALPTLKREIAEIFDAAETGFSIEANDVTAIAAVSGRPHVIGPLFNTYNEDTLAELALLGATTVCLPPELPLSSIQVLSRQRNGVELEVFAFGRAPLAIAARCYHARTHGLMKDACRYVCEEDPDGLEVETLDGQRFLAINGVQTLADGITVLAEEVADLQEAGVSRLRLSPHTCDMVAVAHSFRDLIEGRSNSAMHLAEIGGLGLPGRTVNGYLHSKPGAALAQEVDWRSANWVLMSDQEQLKIERARHDADTTSSESRLLTIAGPLRTNAEWIWMRSATTSLRSAVSRLSIPPTEISAAPSSSFAAASMQFN